MSEEVADLPTPEDVAARFGVSLDVATLFTPSYHVHWSWSYSSQLWWIRNRLYDAGYFKAGKVGLPAVRLDVLMHVGIGRERIRQIEAKAIRKLGQLSRTQALVEL